MKQYFSHDEGARNDPKLVEVLMVIGHEGKSVYWDLIEMLYEQGGYLMHSQCKGYAFALRTDCELIKKLVSDFGLFTSDGEKFWSETALRRLSLRNAKSEKAKESAAKRWSNSGRNANALPTQCEGNAIKGKEIKGKEKIVDKSTTSLRSVNVRKDPELFTSFWQTYPRKESRMDALRAFNKLNADEQATATQSVVEWFARKTDWIRPDGSDYRPHASSWINQKRWQDLTEITITQPPTPHGQPSATSNHFAGYQRSGTASSQYAFTDSAAFDAALQVIKELG